MPRTEGVEEARKVSPIDYLAGSRPYTSTLCETKLYADDKGSRGVKKVSQC